jgi:hypothetical protein
MDNEQKRKDVFTLLKMLKEITKKEPKIWSKLLLDSVNIIINKKTRKCGSGYFEKLIGNSVRRMV